MNCKAEFETIRERPAVATTDTMIREIKSNKLLGADKATAIRHGDQVYTLQLPRAAKLSMTK